MNEIYPSLDLFLSPIVPWLPYAVIVAGLVGAGYMLLPQRKRRPCRWKQEGNRSGTSLMKWRCRTCHAEAFAQGRRPPRECKRGLRVSPL